MTSKARLILDSPAEGAWNMAVDQAILETADKTGLVTLRFYSWSEPTLSLGYFQSHHDRVSHKPSLDCPLVRRRTGGGAIIHDHEITYSLCIPSSNRWSTKNCELYRSIHQCINEVLGDLGIETNLYGELNAPNAVDNSEKPPDKSFLCFQSRSNGDIVMHRQKVVGSAQRRLKNSLLQHGSILLKSSLFSPELLGITDLGGCPVEVSNVSEKMAKSIENRLKIRFIPGDLTVPETEATKQAYSAQFKNVDWNHRR